MMDVSISHSILYSLFMISNQHISKLINYLHNFCMNNDRFDAADFIASAMDIRKEGKKKQLCF